MGIDNAGAGVNDDGELLSGGGIGGGGGGGGDGGMCTGYTTGNILEVVVVGGVDRTGGGDRRGK